MSKFLGGSYKTSYGNTYRVVGYFTENQKGKYILFCDKCSEDKEVFPEGSIVTSSDSVRKMLCVCGCGIRYRWSEAQYKTKVMRLCKDLGYTFFGWTEKYKGYKTKMKLYNPITGNTWTSTSIQPFLRGVRDPQEGVAALVASCKLPKEQHIKDFMNSGSFLDGTEFYNISKNSWYYICPKCSYDEYVKAGVCSGKFKGSTGHLKNGKMSCRYHKPKWTKAQRTYQVNKAITELGGVFKEWTEPFKGRKTKFSWVCTEGHTNVRSFCHFSKYPNCRVCFANGFKTQLPAYLYIVRWCDPITNYSCLKYGITNISTKSRVTSQKKKTTLIPTILYEFHNKSGRKILDCESSIKTAYKGGYCSPERMPRGFSETVEDTPENLEKILSIITDFKIT